MVFVGLALELVGLLVTGRGLLATWRANTADSLLPQKVHRWYPRLLMRLRLRRERRERSGSGAGATVWVGAGAGHAPLVETHEGETTEQRFQRIEDNLRLVHARTLSTMATIRDHERVREEQAADLVRQVEAAKREFTVLSKRIAIDGIRTAVLGLLLLAAGTVVQGASVAF